VKEVRCIQVYRAKYGEVGHRFVASVVDARPDSEWKRGDRVRGVIVSTKKGLRRGTGVSMKFPENGAVLLNKKWEPRGTRITETLPIDLRNCGQMKLLTLAPHVI